MKRGLFFTILFSLVLFAGQISAQETVLTPTPTPTPVIADESKTDVEVKPVDDAQNVQPENLQGVPAIAPGYESEDRALPEIGLVGVDMMNQKPLALREAITLALENNKDIEVTRQNVRIAEFDLRAARGVYEPRFTGQTLYERATVPNLSIFSANETTTNSSIVGNIRYTGFIPKYGTSYYAEANNTSLASNNQISILSPQYNTNFKVGFAQPLFRGRRFDAQRRTIEIAKRNLSLTDTQFRQRSIEIIANVQRAYWDLTFALKNLQVQREGVKDAKEQLHHNRRLVEEGQLAPVDVVAAETQVANLETAVYDALETVNRAENTLKNLIATDRTAQIWTESIVPTESIELDAPRTSLNEALELALENRPEIELNDVAKNINEIDRRFFRDQKKPQIDLTANYISAGVGGSQNPDFRNIFNQNCQPNDAACIVARQQQTLFQQQRIDNLTGNPLVDVLVNRYPTIQVGVTFNFNLDGKTQKAQFGRSLVQSEQIKTQREQIEQNIQVDVRNALQAVKTSEARLRSAAIARENSEAQYASEQRKLDAGQSDIYKVLDRQTALVNARSAELRAQTELNKAIAELQRSTGNSLKANNVEARLR